MIEYFYLRYMCSVLKVFIWNMYFVSGYTYQINPTEIDFSHYE